MILYAFSRLKEKLTQLGYPEAKETGFRLIRVDFSSETFKRAVREGKARFGRDGIYLTNEGKEWKGYMYMPTYHVKKYGSLPRFHLTRCITIERLFSEGFGSLYKWSNNRLNDITDRDNNRVHRDQKLQLCSYCQQKIDGVEDTDDFFKTLEIEQYQELIDVEVDIFGYALDWEKISRSIRKERDYTCENCEIKIENSFDRRFIHVHHKDGNKLNNRKENLECLCVVCHANTDKRHEHNFERKRMQSEINSFLEKYRQQLIEIGNAYLQP